MYHICYGINHVICVIQYSAIWYICYVIYYNIYYILILDITNTLETFNYAFSFSAI